MDEAEPTEEGGARREGGATGRSNQRQLLHRPGERGVWRPSCGPPSSATTLPSFGSVAGGREAAANLLAEGGRRRRKEADDGGRERRCGCGRRRGG
jgi:hypothetical protein